MKSVSILGSTGSVGSQAIDIIVNSNNAFCVDNLVAKSNIEKLAHQGKLVNATTVVIEQDNLYKPLQDLLFGSNIKVKAGHKAIIEASQQSDIIIAAISGYAGLKSTLAAVQSGKCVGIANKESLVCAGKLIHRSASDSGAKIIPVDSEHSSLFRLINESFLQPQSITITASGGPFLNWSKADMEKASLEQALNHPTWSMGRKILIDSATMMNKCLEIIEAYNLFNIKNINVVVQPQSIIHGWVSFLDNSFSMHGSYPDMKIPIGYALYYPDIYDVNVPKINFAKLHNIIFQEVDIDRFPAVLLGLDSLNLPIGISTVINAANEVAVNKFISGHIGFMNIVSYVQKAVDVFLNKTYSLHNETIEDVIALDNEARIFINSL